MAFPDAKWAVDQIVGKLGVVPDNMRKFQALPKDESTVVLKFLEPADSYYSQGGAIAAPVKGVVIRRGTEAYPQDENDGTLVIDNTDLGEYENEGLEVTGLIENQTYYFSAFPYTTGGIFNRTLAAENKVAIQVSGKELVTVHIDIDNMQKWPAAGIIASLVNQTTGASEQRTVMASGAVTFRADIFQQYKVTVTAAEEYQVDKLETEVFTAQPAGSREFTFTYTMIVGEVVKVNVSIDDLEKWPAGGTTISLVNVTGGGSVTEQTQVFVAAGSCQFIATPGQTYKLTVSKIQDYKASVLETQTFVAVMGSERTFTFAYTLITSFLFTIEFDNGADGIPRSFTYSDDCAGFTAADKNGLGSWATDDVGKRLLDYFKPCVIQPGASSPAYFLKKEDRTKKLDGSAAVLTGNDGDVMVQVGKLYYKVVKNTTTGKIKLSIAEQPLDSNYKCFNDVAGVEQDFRYRGCYEASVVNNQLRSVSGVAPVVSQTRAQFRTQARARGNNYAQNDYSLLLLWECMYIMLYGTRDSQTAIGRGYVDGNSARINTGTMNSKPWCWGETTGKQGMVFLGVENFYGNIWEWVDGLTIVNYTYKITRDPAKYDDTGTSYEVSVSGAPSTSGQYVKAMKGTADALFLPENVSGGSETTYFCDMYWISSGTKVADFGGSWDNAGRAGAFCWNLSDAASTSYGNLGSRLCRNS